MAKKAQPKKKEDEYAVLDPKGDMNFDFISLKAAKEFAEKSIKEYDGNVEDAFATVYLRVSTLSWKINEDN